MKPVRSNYNNDGGYDSDWLMNWKPNNVSQGLTNFKMYKSFKSKIASAPSSCGNSRESSGSRADDDRQYIFQYKNNCNDTITEEDSHMVDKENTYVIDF